MVCDNQVFHSLRADCIRRDVPVAESDDERLPAWSQQFTQRSPYCPRGIGKAARFPARERLEFRRDIRSARLAECLLSLCARDLYDCHAHAMPLLFARNDAGKLRLLLRGALIQCLGLHCQICSWLHRLTSRLVFLRKRRLCEKNFLKSPKKRLILSDYAAIIYFCMKRYLFLYSRYWRRCSYAQH